MLTDLHTLLFTNTEIFLSFTHFVCTMQMNPIEYVYTNEHSISSSLKCPICLDILEEPYTHITCDSAFCRSCLLQLNEPICPICRWTLGDTQAAEYNIYLRKTNRLIRNMLDDLTVQCIHCHAIRRRGQFEHNCQTIVEQTHHSDSIANHTMSTMNSNLFQILFSSLVIFSLTYFVYFYRHFIFEQSHNRQHEIIHEIAYNIDDYLVKICYYLFLRIIEYSMMLLILNISIWFSLVMYGDQVTSKTNSRILKNLCETMIMINLLIYSIFNG